MNNKPELLAPAGNIERLKWAVAYGADAVYLGITEFSLRSFAGNFTLDEAREGLDYLHTHNRRAISWPVSRLPAPLYPR
jgi:putative protease